MAMDIFARIGTLAGESVDKVHAGKIDVLAWSWGLSNGGTTHSGGGGGAGKANVQDLSFTKYVDKSSPTLIGASFSGKHFDDAEIIVRKAGGKGAPIEYIKISMTEVLIASVSTGGSGGEDRLTENVVLNFAKVKFEYTEQKPDGAKGATIPVTLNIAENNEE
ncbi:MAG: Hcp family type VI secretion system effector [Betaproteobacteria bacterium]|jgi:type VI secretion system secreted protein Hcp|nr:type VI secretion system tube protein Hcp [Rubrivivax sp.]